MDLEMIKNIAVPIFLRYDVEKAYVFGSFSREEQGDNSDIDFLIEYEPKAKRSLFILVRLKNELQEALQKEVDVVTRMSRKAPGFSYGDIRRTGR